jgi:hypothetical protein
MFVDPDGWASLGWPPRLPYDEDRCRFLERKIRNLTEKILRRENDLATNPQSLPEYIGPGEGLGQTRRGHRTLIEIDQRNRRKYQDEYDKRCDDKDGGGDGGGGSGSTVAQCVAVGAVVVGACILAPHLCAPAIGIGVLVGTQ